MIWAVWHLPVYFVDDQHWSDLVLVVLATIAFTWFFQNALQSVLLAMVVHAMNNTISGEYFSQMFEGADSTRQSWMLVVTWGIAAALDVRRGAGSGRHRRAEESDSPVGGTGLEAIGEAVSSCGFARRARAPRGHRGGTVRVSRVVETLSTDRRSISDARPDDAC